MCFTMLKAFRRTFNDRRFCIKNDYNGGVLKQDRESDMKLVGPASIEALGGWERSRSSHLLRDAII